MIYHSDPKQIKQWHIKGTKPLDIWILQLFDNGSFKCSCPGFSYGGKHFCKHTQSKRLELESIYGNVNNFIKQLKEDGK